MSVNICTCGIHVHVCVDCAGADPGIRKGGGAQFEAPPRGGCGYRISDKGGGGLVMNNKMSGGGGGGVVNE